MKRCMVFVCLVAVGICVASAQDPPKPGGVAGKPIVLSEVAKAIHAEMPVFDGHNDLPWALRTPDGQSFRDLDISRPQPSLHTDLPRLKQGGVGAQFWSAYVPTSTAKKGAAVTTTLEQIDAIHRFVKRYPKDLEIAYTADDVERVRKAGRLASLIGIEGGHSIDNSLGTLRMYYKLGVRYMTLTHSDSLAWADSGTDAPRAKGLSPFGEDVVREMNSLGMLVDLSHVSDETAKAALKIAKAPAIFSHSSARAVADHPRNVPDDILKLVKANGGVVMVNFFSGFITPEGARATKKMFDIGRELAKKYPDDDAKYQEAMREWRKQNDYPVGTVSDVADHIDHIVKTAGIDHVGLGGDYDGISRTPAQLEDVSRYPYLTQELLNRGYSPEDVRKVLGGNILRVLRAAESIAQDSKTR